MNLFFRTTRAIAAALAALAADAGLIGGRAECVGGLILLPRFDGHHAVGASRPPKDAKGERADATGQMARPVHGGKTDYG
jgi:hypothetical protein